MLFKSIHAEEILHQMIGFVDDLHIAIFNTVMHHLHKVACTVLTHPVAAGSTSFNFGSYRLEDLFHMRPCLRRTTRHHRRSFQRSLFTTGNTCTDIEQSFTFHIFRPADSVGEMAVSPVDNDITRFQQRDKLFDKIIHRLTGLDQHHHFAGPLQGSHQFL